jgi:hypothetical protein
MIIKILKELGKYVNMMRRYNKMLKRKVIYKDKEPKLQNKLKI